MARKIEVEILGDSRSLERAFLRSSKAGSNFATGIRNAGLVAGAAIAGFSVIAAKGIQNASNLSEQLNKSTVVFEQNAAEMTAWSQTAADAFGLSQRAALEFAGNFGTMLQTAGVLPKQSAEMSRSLVELGADLASFNNIDPTLALEKLRSGLAGEAEPLRVLGVFLSEARVQAEAFRLGIAEAGDTLTEAQKVQARYSLILQDTGKAQGDFSRTSDSLANATRRVRAQFEDASASIFGKVLPLVADATDAFAGFIEDFSEAKGARAKLDVTIEGLENIGRDVFSAIREQLSGIDVEEAFSEFRTLWLGAIRSLGEFLGQVDFGEIGRTLGSVLSDALSEGAAFLESVDFAEVGGAIVRGIGDFLLNVDWKGIVVGMVKVLVATLNAVGDLLKGVGTELGGLIVEGVGEGIARAKDFVLRNLLEFVNEILGVTGFLGRFDPFAELRGKVQERLAQMEADAAGSMGRIQDSIDGLEDKTVKVTVDTIVTGEGPGAGETVAGDKAASKVAQKITADIQGFAERFRDAANAAVAKAQGLVEDAKKRFPELVASMTLELDEAASTKGFADDLRVIGKIEDAILEQIRIEGRTTDLAKDLFDIRQKRAGVLEAAADAARDAWRDAIQGIELRIDQAEATKGFADDVAANAALQKSIRSRIAVEGETTELLSQLFQAQQKRKQIDAAILEQSRAKQQSDQFRALGLTGDGDKPTPGIANLRKQLGSLEENVKGTLLDTPKTAALFDRVRDVLAGQWGKATVETREKIREFFEMIRGELRSGQNDLDLTPGVKSLDSSAIVKGIGLTPEQAREIQGRLVGMNTAGAALAGGTTGDRSGSTITVGAGGAQKFEFDFYLDGEPIAANVVPRIQKRNNRTPALARGRRAGRSGI